jgi:hypothetical protein
MALELPVLDHESKLSEDGGRGGTGDVAQGVADDEGGRADEIGGRTLDER